MWKKIKIEKILLTSMIFAIGIIINIYIWYYISVQNRKDIIDSKLMYAASNIENLLPKDFHNPHCIIKCNQAKNKNAS